MYTINHLRKVSLIEVHPRLGPSEVAIISWSLWRGSTKTVGTHQDNHLLRIQLSLLIVHGLKDSDNMWHYRRKMTKQNTWLVLQRNTTSNQTSIMMTYTTATATCSTLENSKAMTAKFKTERFILWQSGFKWMRLWSVRGFGFLRWFSYFGAVGQAGIS